MRRILLVLWTVLLASSLTCINARAQATAQVTGTVRDLTAALLPLQFALKYAF